MSFPSPYWRPSELKQRTKIICGSRVIIGVIGCVTSDEIKCEGEKNGEGRRLEV